MGVASGCGEQEAGVTSGSGWNLWVWLLGVVVRRYNRFPHTTYPYYSCICSFCSSIQYIVSPGLQICSSFSFTNGRKKHQN